MDNNESVLGVSGGEPTLLKKDLVDIVKHCRDKLPNTLLHILTNGRSLKDSEFLNDIINANNNIVWGVPIYGSSPQKHDYNVQSLGAFNDTIHGLYNLAAQNQVIELRLVLIKDVYCNLKSISKFIKRNLSFVNTIAIMGLEPIGYARMNRDLIWCDVEEYMDELVWSVNDLASSGLNVLLYNVPLCVMPIELRRFAVKSISDWKNVYLDECFGCEIKKSCCGFFESTKSKVFYPKVYPVNNQNISC